MSAFVDASVWFAAAAKRDAQNERAKSILQSIDQYLTTDLVLVETCQLLKAQFDRGVAEVFWERLRDSGARSEPHHPRRSGCGFGDRGALRGRELFLRRPDEFCPDGAHGDQPKKGTKTQAGFLRNLTFWRKLSAMKPAKTFKQQARVAEKAAQETADEFVSRQMKALASGFRAQAKVLKKKKKKGV
jgi:hypothetical protein